MNSQLQAGTIVTVLYKTGKYVGELIEIRERHGKGIVKVLAVLKHPTQGDLHNPFQTENVFFHQRKALAFNEKAAIPFSAIKPYNEEEIPEYKASLQQSITLQQNELRAKNDQWSAMSLKQLEELKNEYFKQ
ncbi:kinase-associated lipoprotein B [Bacillus taeanensis]|uniref:Kinase n=1 Tax=Bacillus taeanensis TaxID=273032 RepID=A0A366XZZ7_9BACI|nr:kinase-associated lipoprotein B [Bacillus taeanensis]RBW69491.1 kinase [Bacillus taeanensis]